MRNKIFKIQYEAGAHHLNQWPLPVSNIHPRIYQLKSRQQIINQQTGELPEILFITSYPPRECGIANYSKDLIQALNTKFSSSLAMKVCALESDDKPELSYPSDVKYVLNTSIADNFGKMALKINNDRGINLIIIQHEFSFFKSQEKVFLQFVNNILKPVVIVFHTVLPTPDESLKAKIQDLAAACESIVVMTENSAKLLTDTYDIPQQKIAVIAHGTHLVPHLGKEFLKKKYGLNGLKVLSTFGLLSSGKSIETTLEALPAIIKKHPDIIFLVIGATHPEVLGSEGEKYRSQLESIVITNKLTHHVQFINEFLPLPDLLEYLQLTDIYLLTTNDPNQAVSGTFAYAMSCACPIISTPIPHAREVLTSDTVIIFDFRNSKQLAGSVVRVLNNNQFRKSLSSNTLQKVVSTAWDNSAIAHALLFRKVAGGKLAIEFNLPGINLDHLMRMTTNVGLIQFSRKNQPDILSGYTLDDNARAVVATGMYLKLTNDEEIVYEIQKYLSFIELCQQPAGDFLNYVDKGKKFTSQNQTVNLDDANGTAVWALGYLISLKGRLPVEIISRAEKALKRSLPHISSMRSNRAIAFAIKGIYYYNSAVSSSENVELIRVFADRLMKMYTHESEKIWNWFEGYMTYANSILPEAVLYAWLLTGNSMYKEIAITTFDFLLSKTFKGNSIEVISNRSWLQRGPGPRQVGQQPIDIAYTVLTLSTFLDALGDVSYRLKMNKAFSWFLGNNRLHQTIYNPCTGGCYDGLEDFHVNINQGAESTVSYLLARLTIEKYKNFDSSLNP